MKLKLNKSIFSVNSSPEAIVHLVQKVLLTCTIKQKIKPVALNEPIKWEHWSSVGLCN